MVVGCEEDSDINELTPFWILQRSQTVQSLCAAKSNKYKPCGQHSCLHFHCN